MIIKRHFNRELVYTSLGIITILLVIFIGQSSIKYLKYVLKGIFPFTYILEMIILEIPYLLSLLIPLGFFLSAIVVYSRMHADQEMVIWLTSGVSRKKLLSLALRNSLLVSLCVAVLSIWLGPMSINSLKNLRSVAKSDVLAKMFAPGQFALIDGGLKVVYIDKFTKEGNQAHGIFIAEHSKKAKKGGYDFKILVADTGRISNEEETGKQYAVLENGHRYSRDDSQNMFRSIKFDEYIAILPQFSKHHRETENMMTISQLLNTTVGSATSKLAEFHWRIAHPISVIILMLIAYSISRTGPRSGRYSKILPAVVLYIGYYNLLFFGRNAIREETVSAGFGLWWVHIVFLCLGIILFNSKDLSRYFKRFKRK